MADQLRQLIWPRPSQKSYAEAVLRRLFDAAYFDRIPVLDGRGPARIAYVLGPAGRRYEAQRLGTAASLLGPRPAKQRRYKPLFLNHHLATVQFVLNVRLAAERLDGALTMYVSERELRRERLQGNPQFPVTPDALVALGVGGSNQGFVIELDRATKSLRSWEDRINDYWNAHARTVECDSPLPILIVVDTDRRVAARRVEALKSLIDINAYSRDASVFWLTTLAEATPSAVLSKAIWLVGGSEQRHALLPQRPAERSLQ